MGGIKFYTVNSKKFSKNESCIKNNQEQANTYYKNFNDYIINENETLNIKITNPLIITSIESIVNLKLGEMIMGIRKYKNNYAVTIYFNNGLSATHYTVSYLYCEKESNYDLANGIVDYLSGIK